MAVVVRPAQPDTTQLPRVVGGRAAAPPEWQVWSEEPGHDRVALEGGHVVGGLHVSLVGRAEAWLENLRVHPEFQGRGIAGHLVREAEQLARHYGAAIVRTAIPAHDYAAQAVAERGGYRRVMQCVVVEAPISSGPVYMPYDAPVDAPRPERAPEAVRFIERTPTVHGWELMVPLGWRFRRVVPDLLTGLIKDRRVVLALRPGSGRAGQGDNEQGVALFAIRQDVVVVSLVDGTPSGMQAVYGAVLERAREQHARRVVAFALDTHALSPLGVREWAPHPWCPDGLVVVEKNLAS